MGKSLSHSALHYKYRIIHFKIENFTEAMARKGEYDPWTIPDDFTVYKSAPEWLQPLLHPHWQTQKAVHPFFSYFCGLYLLVGGN